MKSPYPTRSPESFDRGHVMSWLVALTLLAGVASGLKVYTGFNLYDDEGSMMMSVKQYLEGLRIYQDGFSLYGPVYYFFNWLIRTATATPVTHDVVRMSSLLPWLGTALICAWIALRLTKSLVVAAAAHLVTSLMMIFFRAEPGHPQELALLLLMSTAACPLWLSLETRPGAAMIVLGALAASLMLIKVNLGVFAVAAVALALLAAGPRTGVWRLLGWAAATGAVLLPVALMKSHLDAGWARSYCCLEMASIGAALVCLFGIRQERRLTVGNWAAAIVGFAATTAAVLAIMQAQGVSPAELYESLVAAPSRIFVANRNWFKSPSLLFVTPLVALAGLALAAFAARTQERLLWVGKAAFSASALVVTIFHQHLLTFVTPFAWLVLFNPIEEDRAWQAFPRSLLCILAVTQTMYAYPVAGSQSLFIQIPLLVVVAVCVGDSLAWLMASGAVPQWVVQHGRAVAMTLLVGIATVQIAVSADRYLRYRSLPSLELAGAGWVHAEADIKQDFQWLVRNLKQECDTFVSLPGLPSLHFWTGMEPLTGLNVALTEKQPERVIAAISTHPRACVVYNDFLMEFWNRGGQSVEHLPLTSYAFQNFKPAGASGHYQLMIRKERGMLQMPPLAQ